MNYEDHNNKANMKPKNAKNRRYDEEPSLISFCEIPHVSTFLSLAWGFVFNTDLIN